MASFGKLHEAATILVKVLSSFDGQFIYTSRCHFLFSNVNKLYCTYVRYELLDVRMYIVEAK